MTQVYPVGGGKGGIGKSLIAANIGTVMARHGKRVLLIDLDLGSSNLHSFLGQTDTPVGLDAYLDKSVDSLAKAAVPTGISNLDFISSKNCSTEAANLYTAQKQKIIRAIGKLDYDYVFMDLGAGTHFNMLDFFLTSGQGICIMTSEPTAIENTFAFLKAVYFRVVKQTLKMGAFKKVLKELDQFGNGMDQYFPMIEAIAGMDPEKGALLKDQLNAFRFHFVVNMVRKTDDPGLGKKIERVCNRHFYSPFKFLGNVSYGERVHDSVHMRQNFAVNYAYTTTANDLARVTRNLISHDNAQDNINTW